MIFLNEEKISEIKTHGERAYPNECCGLLIGRFERGGRKTVVEIFSIENAREEAARHNRSLITPQDLMRGERYARERKLDVVGNYHSHPDYPAVPSQFDLDHALPVWTYIIISVLKGKAVDVRSWEMENDRSKFNEEKLSKTLKYER
ncbi:MAG: M67 family metallopeptidase [Acidobacteriota bacterium]|nr:M67 family metallopeptidase [Acidobacteriota bacterium]